MAKVKTKTTYSDYDRYEHHDVRQMTPEEYLAFSLIMQTQSVSYNVAAMRIVIQRLLSSLFQSGKIKAFRTDKYGNIMAIKGSLKSGQHYPAVACHIDTVHSIVDEPKLFEWIDPIDGRRQWFSADGIGGDDKCGIFVTLSMLANDNITAMKAFFYADEEVGAVGAKASTADKSWYNDVGYIIEADRRGSTDLIFAANGTAMASKTFKDLVIETLKPMGFSPATGSYTDVMKIQDKLNVSVMNISCGYYDPHSTTESIDESDLLAARDAVGLLITELGPAKYEHEQPKWSGGYYNRTYGQTNYFKSRSFFNGTYVSKKLGEIEVEYEVTVYETYTNYFWTFRRNHISLPASRLPPDVELALKQTLLWKWGLIGKKKATTTPAPKAEETPSADGDLHLPPAPHQKLLTFPSKEV